MENKNSVIGVDVDLLGAPLVELRDPRGRPKYAKSEENQLLVMTLAAKGWRQAQIAAFLQCDEKTLRKHYSRELEHGALFLEGIAMQVLTRKMLTGNMGAIRDILEITSLQAPRASKKPEKPETDKPAPIGKKQALVDAAGAPTEEWADLLAPVDDDQVH